MKGKMMQKEQPEALLLASAHPAPKTDRSGCTAGTDEECKHRHCATQCPKRAQIGQGVQGIPAEKLKPVIQWLEAGCEPKHAAIELRILASAPPAPQASVVQQEHVGWACWANAQDPKKDKPALTSYEPTAFENRVKVYTHPAQQAKPQPLTDEQIKDEEWRLSAEREYEKWTGSEYLVVDGAKTFARAIEAAATEPLLQRIEELEEMNAQLREQNTEVDKACAELERQLEQSRKDAERYRWLRANWFTMTATYKGGAVQFYLNGPEWSDQSPDTVDAAIDAAMQKGQS